MRRTGKNRLAKISDIEIVCGGYEIILLTMLNIQKKIEDICEG